jgi:hypothetical protein
VTGKEGMLRRIDDASLQEILNMESYRSHQFFVEAGEPIKKTQNCFSWGGAVTLANTCSASLERDYARSVMRRSVNMQVLIVIARTLEGVQKSNIALEWDVNT